MGLTHWRTPDVRFAELAGDRTHHCASTVGDCRPPAAGRRRGDDDGSTVELRLYLPQRAWHFIVTRNRLAPVAFRSTVQTDDRDQIAASSGL